MSFILKSDEIMKHGQCVVLNTDLHLSRTLAPTKMLKRNTNYKRLYRPDYFKWVCRVLINPPPTIRDVTPLWTRLLLNEADKCCVWQWCLFRLDTTALRLSLLFQVSSVTHSISESVTVHLFGNDLHRCVLHVCCDRCKVKDPKQKQKTHTDSGFKRSYDSFYYNNLCQMYNCTDISEGLKCA